jgi:hypothetical protein
LNIAPGTQPYGPIHRTSYFSAAKSSDGAPAPLADHADGDLVGFEHLDELRASELTALIGIGDLGFFYRLSTYCKASMQKSACIVFENRQNRILRLYQSITPTRNRNPRRIAR